MKLLLYCTKAKPYLHKTQCIFDNSPIEWQLLDYDHYKKDPYDAVFGTLVCDLDRVNGKIVAECDFEVEEIRLIETPEYAGSECNTFLYDVSTNFETKTLTEDKLCKQSCLKATELDKYLDLFKEREIYGYAIHIKNLNIFDKPKELNSYYSQGQVDWIEETELWRLNNGIITAPQNMCYAYKYSYSKGKLEKYVLISIRPEWLCKILNGEKTIEVRKKVLKEMK